MVGKIQKILMVGLFSVTSSAYSMETLIDFDNQEQVFDIPELTIQNVTFSMYETEIFISDIDNLLTFPEELSSRAHGFSNGVLFFNGTNRLTFSFDKAVSAFSFDKISSSSISGWELSAFDESNSLIASVSLVEREWFGSIASSEDNISYATLTKDGVQSSALIIDNFRYTEVSPVPEPSSYALMLGGLGLVGFMAYRRKKACVFTH